MRVLVPMFPLSRATHFGIPVFEPNWVRSLDPASPLSRIMPFLPRQLISPTSAPRDSTPSEAEWSLGEQRASSFKVADFKGKPHQIHRTKENFQKTTAQKENRECLGCLYRG